MSRVGLYFPRWAKAVLYAVLLLSLGTGTTWYVLERWFQIEGEFGPEKHPWQPSLIKLHGASAFASLMGFGYLLASHLPVAWKARRNRASGLMLTGIFGVQILSGYGLYYASEPLRETVSSLHLISGLAFPILLMGHLFFGHRSRRKLKATAA
jgi:hypothetical protein